MTNQWLEGAGLSLDRAIEDAGKVREWPSRGPGSGWGYVR